MVIQVYNSAFWQGQRVTVTRRKDEALCNSVASQVFRNTPTSKTAVAQNGVISPPLSTVRPFHSSVDKVINLNAYVGFYAVMLDTNLARLGQKLRFIMQYVRDNTVIKAEEIRLWLWPG